MAKFDPLLSEHVRRVEKWAIKDHYLGKHVQNEIIAPVVEKTLNAVADKVKMAKYFSSHYGLHPRCKPL